MENYVLTTNTSVQIKIETKFEGFYTLFLPQHGTRARRAAAHHWIRRQRDEGGSQRHDVYVQQPPGHHVPQLAQQGQVGCLLVTMCRTTITDLTINTVLSKTDN